VSSTPVLEKATRTIRVTVSDTVAKTDKMLGGTAAGPVVDVVNEVVKDTVENGESSTGQGNSHPLRHQVSDAANTFAGLLASTSGPGGSRSTAASSGTDDSPANGPAGAPTLPDPCTSPSGSGSSSSFTPAGVIESSLLVTPSVLRDPRSWRLARLPGGPAYQPGCSPD
jgi:hypothetical protein